MHFATLVNIKVANNRMSYSAGLKQDAKEMNIQICHKGMVAFRKLTQTEKNRFFSSKTD